MEKIDKIIQFLDRVFWAMVFVWLVLDAFGIGLIMLFFIGMIGIAIVFFIEANRPIELDGDANSQGFNTMLGLVIIPKVLGISSSVATVGIMFYQLQMPGYGVMLSVGFASALLAMLVLAILKVSGVKHLEALFPRLIKSLVVVLTAFVILHSSNTI